MCKLILKYQHTSHIYLNPEVTDTACNQKEEDVVEVVEC